MDESLAKIRHERSKKDFPALKLEDGEYVEIAFKRAKICLWMIMLGLFFAIVVILLGFLLALIGQSMLDEMGKNFVFIILMTLMISSVIMAFVAIKIYNGNRLFITNKRVIQMLMSSLVSSSLNAIDLASVEDVSFRQDGLAQKLFKYGTLRLATVGDETTYTFKFSDINDDEMESISKLVTKAKKRSKKDED